ncbi:hypothetical protein B0G76_3972 [Paraburkholderia sp. BL23I1N1]|nr:hypothetical protein B0G76_3972 [Paraburkholderia sp. BL23I1N1]
MLAAIRSGSTAKKCGSFVGMAKHLSIDTARFDTATPALCGRCRVGTLFRRPEIHLLHVIDKQICLAPQWSRRAIPGFFREVRNRLT